MHGVIGIFASPVYFILIIHVGFRVLMLTATTGFHFSLYGLMRKFRIFVQPTEGKEDRLSKDKDSSKTVMNVVNMIIT